MSSFFSQPSPRVSLLFRSLRRPSPRVCLEDKSTYMTKADGGSRYDLSASFWRGTAGGFWAVALVATFLLVFHMVRALVARRRLAPKYNNSSSSIAFASSSSSSVSASVSRVPNSILSDVDLRDFIDDLHGKLSPGESLWEDVVDKSNGFLSYNAKCCRQKDGSLKYLSVTTFENCTTELLRDFYMDNDYRKKWDNTIIDHEQLELDEINMIEIGRTIKKFPFLTPREYVLAWRIWEGKNKTFYCIIKDCEHPLAPFQKKYVRVGFFRSGWCIREVAGDSCEIMMVHQEDAGLNAKMAKLAFAKGIWNYVCRMNSALRDYSSWIRITPKQNTSLRCVQIPANIECEESSSANLVSSSSKDANLGSRETFKGSPSKKWMTKGFLLLGGAICLSRCHSTLATQLVMAFFLKKLARPRRESEE